jgi:hypothetical protein
MPKEASDKATIAVANTEETTLEDESKETTAQAKKTIAEVILASGQLSTTAAATAANENQTINAGRPVVSLSTNTGLAHEDSARLQGSAPAAFSGDGVASQSKSTPLVHDTSDAVTHDAPGIDDELPLAKRPRLTSNLLQERPMKEPRELGQGDFMCLDIMPGILGSIFADKTLAKYSCESSTAELHCLTLVGVIAVAGHILGYSSCVGSILFNNRVATLADQANKVREKAIFVFSLSRLSRFIIAANLLRRQERLKNDEVNRAMAVAQAEQLQLSGKGALDKKKAWQESKHYKCESPACFSVQVAGNKYVLDSASWVFAAMKETSEHSVLRGLGTKLFSFKIMQEKMHLRGQTLVLVLDAILTFHCGCKVRNANTALTIAGYPSNNRKRLKPTRFGISPSPIERPPVNIETLCARAMVAADSCYSKRSNLNGRVTKGEYFITLADAEAWRQDTHLGRYNVAGIFGDESKAVTTASEYTCESATDL